MEGTIYDSASTEQSGLPGKAQGGTAQQARAQEKRAANARMVAPTITGPVPSDASRVAVIYNPRSHGVKTRGLEVPPGVICLAPRTRPELAKALTDFAAKGVELIVVAGGDGTVRDVLTCGGAIWGESVPCIAVLPKGKTNALAIDLGIGKEWSVRDAIGAWREGRGTQREPIEVARPSDRGEPPVRGFLFGAGIFVSATDLAQTTHRLGAFNNIAVGLSIMGSIANIVFGWGDAGWRDGKRVAIRAPGLTPETPGMAALGDRNRLIMLISTMHRLPTGVKPFGKPRGGMKMLVADAPVPRFLRNFWRAARGTGREKLARDGVHLLDALALDLEVEDGFVLDGELFPAGRYELRQGAPIAFVTP